MEGLGILNPSTVPRASLQRGQEMSGADKEDETLATRRKLYMDRDFDPGHSTMPFDMRLVLAAEYAAYQLGQINRKLERLIEVGELIGQTRSKDDRR